MSDNNERLSLQTLRVMRSAVNNAPQYSDDELVATGVIMGSLFATMSEVPMFLPMKEQVSFFTNLISCFIVPDMINSGVVNPHMAGAYLAKRAKDEVPTPGAAMLSDESGESDDASEDIVVFSGGGKNVN